MRLLYKRTLIMFSVALNIGFVIMAVIMVFHHSESSRRYNQIINIVHSLSLPQAREDKVLDSIRQFKTAIEKQEQRIKEALDNLIRLAGENGPLDQNRLHQLFEAANQEEMLKNELLKAHVIELRNLLGDEKGAQFYSLLLEHIKNKDKSHHR